MSVLIKFVLMMRGHGDDGDERVLEVLEAVINSWGLQIWVSNIREELFTFCKSKHQGEKCSLFSFYLVNN